MKNLFKRIINWFKNLFTKKTKKPETIRRRKAKKPTPEELGYKIIEHYTSISESKFNEKFLKWCIKTNTNPKEKEAVKGFITFFCEKNNYHAIKRVTDKKGKAFYNCIVRKRMAV